nr:MAG TPA: hypothetical protein [Caudoviricetes sp.]
MNKFSFFLPIGRPPFLLMTLLYHVITWKSRGGI